PHAHAPTHRPTRGNRRNTNPHARRRRVGLDPDDDEGTAALLTLEPRQRRIHGRKICGARAAASGSSAAAGGESLKNQRCFDRAQKFGYGRCLEESDMRFTSNKLMSKSTVFCG
uniref:Uncharacterized protein n=1 Tax=Zea mays TaxID=4577 RepID=A0A804PXS8_MAIZE